MSVVWLPALAAGSGTDVFTRRLADALNRHGVSAQIRWFHHGFELAPFLLRRIRPPAGTRVIMANSWNGFAFHGHGCPLVITEHHCAFDPAYRRHQSPLQALYQKQLIRRYAERSYALGAAVTAVSAFTAGSLKRVSGIDQVEVIPNWVDAATFRPASSRAPQADPRFRLLFVGNLSQRKGADLLPAIMRRLGPAFVLHYTSGLRAGAITDAPANMVALGRLDAAELIRQYQAADALLLPSRFEGFGYSAAEAMACALPVIASAVSALPEVVGNGEGGLLCPPDDVEAFVAAAQRLREDRALRRQLGEAGRARVERLFVESVALPPYLALLERVMAARGQP